MGNSINTYRIRYLKDTSLQIAYVQGEDQEKATKEFLEKFRDIQAEKILSVVNIQETKEAYDISKIIKITASIFITLIGVYGIYLGWNSYKQMSSNEDAKHAYPSYAKQERINPFSSKKRSDPKSERRKDLGNSNSYSSEGQKDQLRSKDYQKEFKDAIKKDDISAVQKILKKKVPTSVIENSGTMGWICLAASEEISTLFLKYGVSPNAECYTRTHIKLPWLVLAVRDNRLDLVKQLLLHGASVYVLDNNGRNLLELASSNEMRNILKQNMSKEKAKEFHKTINYKESLNLKIKNKEYKSNKCIKSKQNKEVCSEIGLVCQVVNNSRDRAVMININNAISRVVNFYKKEGIPNPDFASNVSLSLNIKLKEVSPKQFTIAVIGNRFYWRTIVIDEAYIFSTSTGEKIGGDYLKEDNRYTEERSNNPVFSKKEDTLNLENENISLSVHYKKSKNKVSFIVHTINKYANAKGGVSVSFPDIKGKGKIHKISKSGFDSIDIYPSGKKIWNAKLKKQMISKYSLVEGWSKKWKQGRNNRITFEVDTRGLMQLRINVRALLLKNKNEKRLPVYGKEDQQGYPVKQLVIELSNTKAARKKEAKSALQDRSLDSSHKLIRTLGAPDLGVVQDVTFSPDGTMIASSDGESVRVWDVKGDARLLHTLKNRGSNITCIAFSLDGTTVASGSYDWTIKLWDVQSGKLVSVVEDKGSAINDIDFSPDSAMIASVGEYGVIKLWNTQTGKMLKKLGVNGMPINDVTFSPDGTLIATGGGEDSTVRLWDIQSGKQIKTLKGHYYGLAFSPNGNLIASGDGGAIKLWDTQSGKLLNTLKGHKDVARSIAFSPDGTKIVSSGLNDHTVKLWDVQSGRLLDTLRGHKGSVNSVAFSPDGTKIASASRDKTIKLWDMNQYIESSVNKRKGSISKIPTGKNSINLNSSFVPKQKDQQHVQSYITDNNQLVDATLCGSSDTVVLSCNIKQKILSVCQQKNNKFVYKYGKPHKVELSISSNPLFSHKQFIRMNVESRLRFHNKGYDYIVYSNDLFTYDKHPNDGTGVYKAGHGVYVVKNNKLLANLKCTKTYPYMEDIYKFRNNLRHEKYSFLDGNVLSKQKAQQQVQSHISTSSQLNTGVDTHGDGSETYFARISQKDHYGARNKKLKDVGIILQQDRANYHKYQRRDREDSGDNRFDTRGNRNKIKKMLARGSTSQKTLDAIRYGTPLVKVKIYQNHIDVTLESGGGQTQQRQQKKNSPQTRQNKSKKSKCNTVGSIRGISRRGDGFVAVRKGPGTKYRMIGKIYRNGTRVKICDRKGKWKGIIYGDCISGSSKSRNGSCTAGWVYEKYIRIR